MEVWWCGVELVWCVFWVFFLFFSQFSSFFFLLSLFLSSLLANKAPTKIASEDVWSAWFVVKTMTVDVFDPLTFVLAR